MLSQLSEPVSATYDADERMKRPDLQPQAASTTVAEAERPAIALFLKLATTATDGNVLTAWVAEEPDDEPVLVVAYDPGQYPRSVVDLIVAHRHGVPVEVEELTLGQHPDPAPLVEVEGELVNDPIEGPAVRLRIGDTEVSLRVTDWLADAKFPASREVRVDVDDEPVELSLAEAAELPAALRVFADQVAAVLAQADQVGGH
jgi:hypothetical protein